MTEDETDFFQSVSPETGILSCRASYMLLNIDVKILFKKWQTKLFL
jgi:hypothetical protein